MPESNGLFLQHQNYRIGKAAINIFFCMHKNLKTAKRNDKIAIKKETSIWCQSSWKTLLNWSEDSVYEKTKNVQLENFWSNIGKKKKNVKTIGIKLLHNLYRKNELITYNKHCLVSLMKSSRSVSICAVSRKLRLRNCLQAIFSLVAKHWLSFHSQSSWRLDLM